MEEQRRGEEYKSRVEKTTAVTKRDEKRRRQLVVERKLEIKTLKIKENVGCVQGSKHYVTAKEELGASATEQRRCCSPPHKLLIHQEGEWI